MRVSGHYNFHDAKDDLCGQELLFGRVQIDEAIYLSGKPVTAVWWQGQTLQKFDITSYPDRVAAEKAAKKAGTAPRFFTVECCTLNR